MTHNPANLSPEQVGAPCPECEIIGSANCPEHGEVALAGKLSAPPAVSAGGCAATLNITADQLDRALIIQRIFRRKMELGGLSLDVSEDEIAAERVANFRALQSENAELRARLERMPANWMEDSSLETWFPSTSKELINLNRSLTTAQARIEELEGVLASVTDKKADWLEHDMDHRNKDHSQWWKAVEKARAALAKKGAE